MCIRDSFNVTPQLAPFVGGIAVSMEEKVAKGELEGAAVAVSYTHLDVYKRQE